MERAIKKKTRVAIISCVISMVAIIVLFIGLSVGNGIAINIIFAGYAISLAVTGKSLLELLRTSEDK